MYPERKALLNGASVSEKLTKIITTIQLEKNSQKMSEEENRICAETSQSYIPFYRSVAVDHFIHSSNSFSFFLFDPGIGSEGLHAFRLICTVRFINGVCCATLALTYHDIKKRKKKNKTVLFRIEMDSTK